MKDKGIDENMVGNTPLFTNANGRQLTTAGLAHIINMYAVLVRNLHPELLPEKSHLIRSAIRKLPIYYKLV